MAKEEWNKLPESKFSESRKIRQALESSFPLARMNVGTLVKKGIFSFLFILIIRDLGVILLLLIFIEYP